MNCASGLDHRTAGTGTICGHPLSGLREDALARFRREHFQHLNLLPYLSAQENAELPLRLAGRRAELGAVPGALTAVGLDGLGQRLPAELSAATTGSTTAALSGAALPDDERRSDALAAGALSRDLGPQGRVSEMEGRRGSAS